MAEGGVPCSFSCVICGQDGLSDDEMRSHILLEHIESSVCCPFCDLQGDSIEDVEDHLYSEHQDVLSPSKKLNGGADITNIQDIHVKRGKGVSSQKSSSKKGKKAPYVNLEYFNKSLVDMTCDGSSRGYEIPVLHMGSSSKGETENTITGLADSTSDSPDKNVFVNAETGEKMYRLPVTHMFSNRSESSPGKMSSLASKRARLSLDVSPCSKSSPSKSSGETSSSTSSGSEFHCPLCKFKTSSEAEIQRHVNISHLDVLSPAKPTSGSSGMPVDSATAFSQVENGTSLDNEQYMEIIPEGEPMPSTSHMVYECPICSMHLDSSLSLELHVNSKHSDVLSPDVPASGSDSVLAEATTTSPMEDDNLCPVCGLRISDPVSMTSHVETHFLPERTPGEVAMEERDVHMASEIQASERASQMSVDAAMAADLVNRERMDELLAKDLAEKEERTQLDEQKEFERLQAKYGMDDKNSYKKQYELSLERAVCKGQITMTEFYNHKSSLVNTGVNGIDDGHSCTKGILSQLERFYEHLPAAVSCMWLCSEADHFAASHGDKGWGCGYRNFQMLLSSLSNHQPYHKVLFNGRPMIPSIPKIQRLIEAAWQKGFDTQGADQLGGKLVNTSKWIGATEITATLLSLKVRCELLDFHQPTGPGGTHPRMLDWVRDYFIRTTGHRPPLYLQHHGHSRTIIGVEELKDGNLRLLLFDPSCSKRQMEQFIEGVTGGKLRTLRRAAQSLKAKQYQIVAVTGILDELEYENRKVIRSQRIP